MTMNEEKGSWIYWPGVFYLLFLGLIFLIAIESIQEKHRGDHGETIIPAVKNTEDIIEHLKYVYDDRSGLCYAYLRENDGDLALAVVPYEKVKYLLINPPKHTPE